MPTPIRFPTEAANADSMRDDAPGPAAREAPKAPGIEKQPGAGPREGDMKAAKDIGVPGAVRDTEAGKP